MSQLNLEARPSDPFRDSCQWDHAPARPVATGDLREGAVLSAVLAQNDEGAG